LVAALSVKGNILTEKSPAIPEQNSIVTLDIPATHYYVPIVEACVVEAILPHIEGPSAESISYGVRLAIHEACTNIIDHAYLSQTQGRIHLTIRLSNLPESLVLELQDTGEPFDETAITEPHLDQPQERGYGVFLMHRLMDEVRYTRTSRGNHWLLTKKLRTS
jgi:serine/threonine-protein kinase RsbW